MQRIECQRQITYYLGQSYFHIFSFSLWVSGLLSLRDKSLFCLNNFKIFTVRSHMFHLEWVKKRLWKFSLKLVSFVSHLSLLHMLCSALQLYNSNQVWKREKEKYKLRWIGSFNASSLMWYSSRNIFKTVTKQPIMQNFVISGGDYIMRLCVCWVISWKANGKQGWCNIASRVPKVMNVGENASRGAKDTLVFLCATEAAIMEGWMKLGVVMANKVRREKEGKSAPAKNAFL